MDHAPSTAQSPFWLTRDCESALAQKIILNRQGGVPTLLFVRGRRQVGKTSTIQTVCRLAFPRHFHYVLMRGPDLAANESALSSLFPTTRRTHAPADVFECGRQIDALIRSGMIVVIDEIQRATAAVQQTLQGVVDAVRLSAMHGERIQGGLVVLGSKTRECDDLAHGYGSPLWHRLESFTILPFLPAEMAEVFRRYSITSGSQQLRIAYLTGGYPEFVQRLAASGALRDDTTAADMVKQLVRHDGLLRGVFADELGHNLARVASLVASKAMTDSECHDRVMKSFKVDTTSAFRLLDRLEQYGVVRLERPMLFEQLIQQHQISLARSSDGTGAGTAACSVVRSPPLTSTYVIWDTRLSWYEALRASSAPTMAGIAQDVFLSVSDVQVAVLRKPMGLFLERALRETVVDRVRYKQPPFPAWRPLFALPLGENTAASAICAEPSLLGASAAPGRQLLADVLGSCGPPVILDGKQHSADGDLDILALFPRDGLIVVCSCKLLPDRLADELVSARADGFPTKTERYTSHLQSRVRVILRDLQRTASARIDADVIGCGGDDGGIGADGAVAGAATGAATADAAATAAVVAGEPGAHVTSIAGIGSETRSAAAIAVVNPLIDDAVDDGYATEYASLLCSASTKFHFVYVAADPPSEACCQSFRRNMNDTQWERTWFASYADFSSFHAAPRRAHALVPPVQCPPAASVDCSRCSVM